MSERKQVCTGRRYPLERSPKLHVWAVPAAGEHSEKHLMLVRLGSALLLVRGPISSGVVRP